MDDLERDELVVGRADAGDEEQRGVAAVDDLGILVLKDCASSAPVAAWCNAPLHMRVLRARTSCVTSCTRENELGERATSLDDLGLRLG